MQNDTKTGEMQNPKFMRIVQLDILAILSAHDLAMAVESSRLACLL